METAKKKSLLERYGIPLHHLDFKYIKDCADGREMEKIVHILSSNEEGYYPDLTKCAEEKLKELKPQSRLFRVEEHIKGREALQADELQPIYDWNKQIKTTDKKLQNMMQEKQITILNDVNLPPVRKGGSILPKQNEVAVNTETSKIGTETCQRISSTDYKKWDKYDAEEEILRLDLAEERQLEEIERKNRLNLQQFSKQPLIITELDETEKKPLQKWQNLSDIEKDKLSEEYRIRGNEYFRAKEYDQALQQYSCAIDCSPTTAVAAYNNRALTYFRQQKFLNSIEDCEQALKLEPNNIKAHLRLAEANYAFGRRRESYELYVNVLKLDENNSVALKATTELRKQFEDLPPPNATRLKIQDEPSKKQQMANQTEHKAKLESELKAVQKTVAKPSTKTVNYDLAELIKPNRVVQNKLFKAAENFGKNITNSKGRASAQGKQVMPEKNDETFALRLSTVDDGKPYKKLIEEI